MRGIRVVLAAGLVVVSSAAASSAAAAPAPARATHVDTVTVDRFMSYNAAAKGVTLQVIAAFDDTRGGLNFNGGSDGDQTVVIPAGWTVHLHMVNKDALPHSAIVIAKQTPPPALPKTPAIAGALTAHLMDGLEPKGGSDDVTFTASPAGSYLLACGVPGHALSGMYIAFDVSSSAQRPSYTK
ncbi:MAG TPA: sulfocyanin-like copper-binding protein [Gemmatimonadaceae bacterium]|nr:sulfocyanin-like copper-binding protein [Gemmatimonadaceae bacterium]